MNDKNAVLSSKEGGECVILVTLFTTKLVTVIKVLCQQVFIKRIKGILSNNLSGGYLWEQRARPRCDLSNKFTQ